MDRKQLERENVAVVRDSMRAETAKLKVLSIRWMSKVGMHKEGSNEGMDNVVITVTDLNQAGGKEEILKENRGRLVGRWMGLLVGRSTMRC